jgi:hypothetical protein
VDDTSKNWLRRPSVEGLLRLPKEDQPESLRALVRLNRNEAARLVVSLAKTDEGLGVVSTLEQRELVLIFAERDIGQADRRVNWFALRPLGHFPLLKVSYLALIAIPLISHVPRLFNFAGPYFFPAAYFGNLSLALASLLYDIFCPIIIKRFASANDLYSQMLDITAKQQNLYPDDQWVGNLDHSLTAYRREATSKPLLAYVCLAFYLIGFACLGYLIWERSVAVFEAAIRNLWP